MPKPQPNPVDGWLGAKSIFGSASLFSYSPRRIIIEKKYTAHALRDFIRSASVTVVYTWRAHPRGMNLRFFVDTHEMGFGDAPRRSIGFRPTPDKQIMNAHYPENLTPTTSKSVEHTLCRRYWLWDTDNTFPVTPYEFRFHPLRVRRSSHWPVAN